MTPKDQHRDPKIFETPYLDNREIVVQNDHIYYESYGHVTDDDDSLRLGGLLGTNNGCKIVINEG